MGPVAVDSTAMVRLAVDDTNKGHAVNIQTEDSDWPQELRSEKIVRSRSGQGGRSSIARNRDNGYKSSTQFRNQSPKDPLMLSIPRTSAMMITFCSTGSMFVSRGGVNNKSG